MCALIVIENYWIVCDCLAQPVLFKCTLCILTFEYLQIFPEIPRIWIQKLLFTLWKLWCCQIPLSILYLVLLLLLFRVPGWIHPWEMFSLPVDYRLKREQGLAASAIGMFLDIQSPFLMGNSFNSGPCNWRERGCQLTAAVSSTTPDKIIFKLLTFRLSVAQKQCLPVGTRPLRPVVPVDAKSCVNTGMPSLALVISTLVPGYLLKTKIKAGKTAKIYLCSQFSTNSLGTGGCSVSVFHKSNLTFFLFCFFAPFTPLRIRWTLIIGWIMLADVEWISDRFWQNSSNLMEVVLEDSGWACKCRNPDKMAMPLLWQFWQPDKLAIVLFLPHSSLFDFPCYPQKLETMVSLSLKTPS